MCHMAANCMNQGKNVLYVSMEMAEERIAERIDANLMNISMEDLHSLPKQMYDDKINKIIKNTQDRLLSKNIQLRLHTLDTFAVLSRNLQLRSHSNQILSLSTI